MRGLSENMGSFIDEDIDIFNDIKYLPEPDDSLAIDRSSISISVDGGNS